MPAAVVGLALVGGGAITAATLGYVALGLTAAGMITKNKTLLKIGGQLGLAAGVSSIASSFMGAGSSAAGAATSGVGEVMSAAAEDAANMGLAAPSGQMGGATGGLTATDLNYSNDAINAAGKPYSQTPGQLKESGWDSAVDYGGKTPDSNVYSTQPTAGAKPTPGANIGANLGTNQGVGQGANIGTSQGANLAPTGPATANDPMGNTSVKAKPDAGFFDSMFGKNADGTYRDSGKYAIVEGGKIIAGGLQGLSATSNANTQLEENRRVGDIQRANMAQVGRGSYGLMGAR